MTNEGKMQNNFTLLSPPVRELAISQDRLDRMNLVCNRTIHIILPSRKKILADLMFKTTPTLIWSKFRADLVVESVFSIMAEYTTTNNVFIGNI